MNIKTKTEAIELFGSREKLVISLDITRQTLHNWPEQLKKKQSDHILGAAISDGYLEVTYGNT